jgi:hypothetical protein
MEKDEKTGKNETEINNIKIGNWTVDLFLNKKKNLGITVYEESKSDEDEDAECVDIFVDRKLNVTSF